MWLPISLGLVLILVASPPAALAQDKPLASDDIGIMNPDAAARAFPKRGYSPYAGRRYPTRVFWGDEHVHTGWSADAGAFGATLGPEDALRFAQMLRVHAKKAKRRAGDVSRHWSAVGTLDDLKG